MADSHRFLPLCALLALLAFSAVRKFGRAACAHQTAVRISPAAGAPGSCPGDNCVLSEADLAKAAMRTCPGENCVLSEDTLAEVMECPGVRCVISETTLADVLHRRSQQQQGAVVPPQHPGHEWIGGAVGYADRPGNAERRYTAARAPRNATVLLLGVVSGSKNFDVRNWVRRAFWLQRPWQLGIDWRFVVGTRLPRGDNDRVSLQYEATRHGDIDIVRGSELPPRQARVAIRWWLHAATLAARPASPRYFGLSYDSVVLSLPRVSMRLLSLAEAAAGEVVQHDTRRVYAGSLRWAAWADEVGTRGATRRCVRSASPEGLTSSRLPGDAALPADPLNTTTRQLVQEQRACAPLTPEGTLSPLPVFPAASPELQLLSTPLLLRAAPSLRRRLQRHQLEASAPAELWERSLVYHQSAAGRTPSQPALLAATALARSVHNASRDGTVTYLQLHDSTLLPAFSWDAEPRTYPGARALLARSVTNGIMAEAVAERFKRQRKSAPRAAGRVRCARERCAAWGFPSSTSAVCCDEEQATSRVRGPRGGAVAPGRV
jgi:hypothetical protein